MYERVYVYNEIVLFLVTRPIMSGVPIFNQMRGRFTLLLYYVALSLCAPDYTDFTGYRIIRLVRSRTVFCLITVYTDTVNFRRARAHHRMYHVIIGSMGVAASYKLSELMAMELQFSREFSLFHAILSLSTHGENLSMASQVIFCSHCDDFVSRAPYYRRP